MIKTGIYIIKNKIDNRCYIGSAININVRWKRHIRDLINNKHHSIHLQRFINKHGIDSIFFEILEECNKDSLLIKEQYYLENSDSSFNVCKIAGSCIGIQRPQDFKDRISILTKGINNPTYGLERTPEWRDKIRQANKGQKSWNKGRKGVYSEETIRKFKEIAKNRIFSDESKKKISDKAKINIFQFNKEGQFIKEWNSIKEASETLNIKSSNICKVLRSSKGTAGKFIWKYKDNQLNENKYLEENDKDKN